MVKIGIIGKGFVGSAVEYGFSVDPNYKTEIKSYDKDPSISTHSLSNVVNNSDFVFISVPTPSHENGTINLNILDDALLSINQEYKGNNTIFLIRSTIIPGSTRKFQEKYQNIRLVFNPEFLTEKNANLDFINQNRFIIRYTKYSPRIFGRIFRMDISYREYTVGFTIDLYAYMWA